MSDLTRDDKIQRAVDRIIKSRQSHVDWAEHLAQCDWCRDDKTTQSTVGSIERNLRVVAEYDEVLEILRSI